MRIGKNALSMHQVLIIVLIIILTILSGWGDAHGFLHASRMWAGGKLIWLEVMKSALGFAVGIGLYWICIRFVQEFKVVSPEVQTLAWFATTMVGLALFSGKFFQWQQSDRIVGIVVLGGIVWLMIRT